MAFGMFLGMTQMEVIPHIEAESSHLIRRYLFPITSQHSIGISPNDWFHLQLSNILGYIEAAHPNHS